MKIKIEQNKWLKMLNRQVHGEIWKQNQRTRYKLINSSAQNALEKNYNTLSTGKDFWNLLYL